MKAIRRAPVLATVCWFCAGPAVAFDAVDRLAWLTGCWSADGEAGNGEMWTEPAGGTMFGISRTVRGGRTVAWEYMRIEERTGGHVYFVAAPSGQAATAFRMILMSTGEVVFENDKHDFPNRVRYWTENADTLRARIDGVIEGKGRSVDFVFRRMACR